MSNTNAYKIRAQLLKRGVTLRQWAMRNKLPASSVYAAVNGSRGGKRSTEILTKINQSHVS